FRSCDAQRSRRQAAFVSSGRALGRPPPNLPLSGGGVRCAAPPWGAPPPERGRLGGGRPTLQQSTKPAAPVLAAVPPAGAAPRWPRRCAGGRRSPQGAA